VLARVGAMEGPAEGARPGLAWGLGSETEAWLWVGADGRVLCPHNSPRRVQTARILSPLTLPARRRGLKATRPRIWARGSQATRGQGADGGFRSADAQGSPLRASAGVARASWPRSQTGAAALVAASRRHLKVEFEGTFGFGAGPHG
jgi:hypothetical protein